MAINTGEVDLSAATAANVVQAGASGGSFVVHINNYGSVTATIELGRSTVSATFQAASKYFDSITLLAGEQASFGPINCEANVYIVGESDVASVNMTAEGVE